MEALHSMQSRNASEPAACNKKLAQMFHLLGRRIFRSLFRKMQRWNFWRRPKAKVVIKRFGKLTSKSHHFTKNSPKASLSERPLTIASFNTALFSLAPAIPKAQKCQKPLLFVHGDDNNNNVQVHVHPKSILKQSPLHPTMRSKQRVSINLPENEISLAQDSLMRSPVCFPVGAANSWMMNGGGKTIFDVLKEVDADILALQDVRAEEEKGMTPLSELAEALGMNYVFAESWAPEFGNAILSKWPIKKWRVQKIYDDKDFRNVLKATIQVPWIGEINFYCTQLDHLDENWRMKQINAIIQSSDHPHILAGGLNSLDASDYSMERWTNIVKYYEELGKPTPKVEVTNFLKEKEYTDAKFFPGEFEPVVIIAKGQSVQGTCKYGTRVDYIVASPDLPYNFVPGSYSVISSKGTSDHHIVKVDLVKTACPVDEQTLKRWKKLKQRVVKVSGSGNSGGLWHL